MADFGWSRDAVASQCEMLTENKCLWDTKDPRKHRREGGRGPQEGMSQGDGRTKSW